MKQTNENENENENGNGNGNEKNELTRMYLEKHKISESNSWTFGVMGCSVINVLGRIMRGLSRKELLLELIKIPIMKMIYDDVIPATTLYDCLYRLFKFNVLTKSKNYNGKIGRPITMWALSQYFIDGGFFI